MIVEFVLMFGVVLFGGLFWHEVSDRVVYLPAAAGWAALTALCSILLYRHG